MARVLRCPRNCRTTSKRKVSRSSESIILPSSVFEGQLQGSCLIAPNGTCQMPNLQDFSELQVNFPIHRTHHSKVPADHWNDLNITVTFDYPILATLNHNREIATLAQYKIRGARVTWDYNSGYVHLPGICKLSNKGKSHINRYLQKTKKLNAVVIPAGLSHLQGTWLEFETCKKVAARISYYDRYALVPIFGEDFIDMCLKPEDDGYSTLCDRGTYRKKAEPEHSITPSQLGQPGQSSLRLTPPQAEPSVYPQPIVNSHPSPPGSPSIPLRFPNVRPEDLEMANILLKFSQQCYFEYYSGIQQATGAHY